MYRVPVFTLGTTLIPLHNSSHAYTNTRERARGFCSFSVFFFFLFPLSTLQLAVPLARLSFYSFRTRALAFTHTHAWSRTHATEQIRSYNSCPVRSFFFFFPFLHNHHRVKPHLPRPAVAQQPPVANKMLYR